MLCSPVLNWMVTNVLVCFSRIPLYETADSITETRPGLVAVKQAQTNPSKNILDRWQERDLVKCCLWVFGAAWARKQNQQWSHSSFALLSSKSVLFNIFLWQLYREWTLINLFSIPVLYLTSKVVNKGILFYCIVLIDMWILCSRTLLLLPSARSQRKKIKNNKTDHLTTSSTVILSW